jgi:hypothetical protein
VLQDPAAVPNRPGSTPEQLSPERQQSIAGDLEEAKQRRLALGSAPESSAPADQAQVITEDLGFESTGDPGADAILKQRRDTIGAIRQGGKIGTTVGEGYISVATGTGDDAKVLWSGKDIHGREQSRWMAGAGIIIPGVSGKELKAAKELAEQAAKARKPLRELMNAGELKRFEQLKKKYPDFMPDVDTPARVLTPAEVKEARRRASRGGHHRHPLAFEGEPKPAEGLVPTGDTHKAKGQEHKEVTNFWNDVLRRARREEKK